MVWTFVARFKFEKVSSLAIKPTKTVKKVNTVDAKIIGITPPWFIFNGKNDVFVGFSVCEKSCFAEIRGITRTASCTYIIPVIKTVKLSTLNKSENPVPELYIVLSVFGNPARMLAVIIIDEPLPIPFSVIISLNHKIIIEPVIRAKVIWLQISKFQMKRIGRKANVIDTLSTIAQNNVR